MLAVDVEQHVAQRPQLCGGCRRAVHPCPALALRVDRAAQQQRVARLESRFVEPGLRPGRAVKLGADVGAGCAFAHHASICARPERQLDSIDQDRLARTGLARQHREA